VRKALEYEIPRQMEVVKKRRQAHPIHQTLDDTTGGHRRNADQGSMRHDYRYVPEPDLMPFRRQKIGCEETSSAVWKFAARYRQAAFHARLSITRAGRTTHFVGRSPSAAISNIFAKQAKNPKAAANWGHQYLPAK